LVRLGHEVTLYASGDSTTRARLRPMRKISTRMDKSCVDELSGQLLMLERITQEASQYDIIHFHIDYLHYPVSRRYTVPHVTTLHGRLDIPELPALYREFQDQPVISISNAQRGPLPMANWVGTVYHGLPKNLYPFRVNPGDYFAFLGRISREKRPDRAIRIATETKCKLKIAAKISDDDRAYYEEEIAPLVKNNPYVELVGEINEMKKQDFLGGARALLFPIDWPEPFGLVTVEALSCGTPVIAFNEGSVPEILEDGVTGYVVDNMEDAIARARDIHRIDRAGCRRYFEERFTDRRMAEDYLAVYQHLIRGEVGAHGHYSARG
jgi:glycosyltransferase involved in cell wall biosynthesis